MERPEDYDDDVEPPWGYAPLLILSYIAGHDDYDDGVERWDRGRKGAGLRRGRATVFGVRLLLVLPVAAIACLLYAQRYFLCKTNEGQEESRHLNGIENIKELLMFVKFKRC